MVRVYALEIFSGGGFDPRVAAVHVLELEVAVTHWSRHGAHAPREHVAVEHARLGVPARACQR